MPATTDDSIAAVLNREPMLIRVTGVVDAALRSTSIFKEATGVDILERLGMIIVLDEGGNWIGRGFFSLTYGMEDPLLNMLFSKKVMDAYLAIFRFRWKLQQKDHLVASIVYIGRETTRPQINIYTSAKATLRTAASPRPFGIAKVATSESPTAPSMSNPAGQLNNVFSKETAPHDCRRLAAARSSPAHLRARHIS